MRTIRAYQLKCGLKLSAYENKVPNLVIKLEIPNFNINDNTALICPLNMSEDSLCKSFDTMIDDCKDSDSENACKSSENIKIFSDIEIFEVTDTITKSISFVRGEYTTLYLERKDDITFIINEINEN